MDRARLCAAIAVTALAGEAHATSHIVDVVWDGDRFQRELTVPAGKFVEVCDKLTAGVVVAWRFESSHPVDFNIHYHEGGRTVVPARLSGSAGGNGRLRVEAQQDHCWMWTAAKTSPATVRIELRR